MYGCGYVVGDLEDGFIVVVVGVIYLQCVVGQVVDLDVFGVWGGLVVVLVYVVYVYVVVVYLIVWVCVVYDCQVQQQGVLVVVLQWDWYGVFFFQVVQLLCGVGLLVVGVGDFFVQEQVFVDGGLVEWYIGVVLFFEYGVLFQVQIEYVGEVMVFYYLYVYVLLCIVGMGDLYCGIVGFFVFVYCLVGGSEWLQWWCFLWCCRQGWWWFGCGWSFLCLYEGSGVQQGCDQQYWFE